MSTYYYYFFNAPFACAPL